MCRQSATLAAFQAIFRCCVHANEAAAADHMRGLCFRFRVSSSFITIVCKESRLDTYLAHCFLIFQGLVELSENESAQDWDPSEAAHFLFFLWNAVQNGATFDMA